MFGNAKIMAIVTLALPLAALAGCVGLSGRAGDDAPPRFYANPGIPLPAPKLLAWTDHLARMATKAFPQADALPPGHALPEAAAARQFAAARGARLALTWFGHSTFLIRIGGRVVMTDPVITERIGRGALHLHRLPPLLPDPALIRRLDVIVISHADYDHLDLPSLEMLAARFPDAQVYVPEGTGFLVRRAGFANVFELAWYERAAPAGLTVTAVPAIHAVRRLPFPVDSMHWAGYVVSDGQRRVYFAGDTAAGPYFAETRRRLGPVDVALVPAGAWSPRGFERPYHAEPEEAAAIARTMGARLAIGMHWGTFALSEEEPSEQKRRFLAASTAQTRTTVFRIGETRVLAK